MHIVYVKKTNKKKITFVIKKDIYIIIELFKLLLLLYQRYYFYLDLKLNILFNILKYVMPYNYQEKFKRKLRGSKIKCR